MDPIAILQRRIEQLEAKLGLNVRSTSDGQQGDSATINLQNAARVSSAPVGHEKLSEVVCTANELNNYTDPNLMEMNDHSKLQHMGAAAVPRHHCSCVHRCKQTLPVSESEPMQHVPEMQASAAADYVHQAASEVKSESDAVSLGKQDTEESSGTAAPTPAAAPGPEQSADAARPVEQVEQKWSPLRRNGLD